MRFTDPFGDIDRFFDQFGSMSRRGGMMPMDAFRKDDEFVLKFDLPGVHPENIDVSVEHQVLTVTAERPLENTDDVNWLLRERPTGNYSRQIRLGATLDAENITAGYDQGVLILSIPVKAEAKPKKIEVGIGSDNKVLEATAS